MHKLLEYFVGEEPLRMSQISRKIEPLRSNYCVLAKGLRLYVFTCTNLGFAILLLRIDQPSQGLHIND